MKRPIAIVAALLAHIACLLWVFYATFLFFEIVTWRLFVFLGLIVLIHFLGIHGLRSRRKWAKRFSKVVFIFYFVMQFGALNKAARSGDPFNVLLSILVGTFIIWLLNALNQPEVESFLSVKEKS